MGISIKNCEYPFSLHTKNTAVVLSARSSIERDILLFELNAICEVKNQFINRLDVRKSIINDIDPTDSFNAFSLSAQLVPKTEE